MNIEKSAIIFESFMRSLGLDTSKESIQDTPNRVAKMYINEIFKGLYQQEPELTLFDNTNSYSEMVIVKDIELCSTCEHHFLPFLGKCHIAYYPKDKILGLSKFSRIVDFFSSKPQVQEKLTQEIGDFLRQKLGTEDIAVYIESEHLCMKIRGVKEACSSTVTKYLKGRFEQTDSKNEFLNNL